MILPANEARLVLADTRDLNNAACVITCWAGPAKASDVRIENAGASFAFVVDKTWCTTQGALKFTPGGTDLCPLTASQTVPAGVAVCRGDGCKAGPVYTVDASGNPVKVTITAPASGRFTINWGTGYLPTTGVATGAQASNTYWRKGTYVVRVQDEATGVFGIPVTIAVTTVPNTITVTCPSDQTSKVGDKVSVTASATGTDPNPVRWRFSAAGLPAGVVLVDNGNGTATMSGTATAGQGAKDVTVTAGDHNGNRSTCTFKWTVSAGTTVSVTKPADQSTAAGTAANLTLSATDSDPSITSFTWTATGLPAGLALDSATGKISGTATTGQSAKDVTVTATDRNGASDSKTFTWTVTTTVTVAAIPDQTWNTAASVNLTLSATDSDPSITSFAWTVSPALPAGVTLNASTGKVTGKPSKAATQATYTFTATDSHAAAGSKAAKVAIQNTVTVAAIADQTFTTGQDITAVQGAATDSDASITTFAWTVSPALPAGLALAGSTGKITGNPNAVSGKKLYTLTATDSSGAAGSKTFNITVTSGS